MKPLSSQVACSSRVDHVFSTEPPLSDSTPRGHPLPTSSAPTVVKIEMAALNFPEHSALLSSGVGVSTCSQCLGLSTYAEDLGQLCVCEKVFFELDMHHLI